MQNQNQNQTKPMTPLREPSQGSPETMKTIAAAVRQSFDIFNTFGKTPAQLDTLTTAFLTALKDCRPEQVNAAFAEWLVTGKTIPTPADIIEIIKANSKQDFIPLYLQPPPSPLMIEDQAARTRVVEGFAKLKEALRWAI